VQYAYDNDFKATLMALIDHAKDYSLVFLGLNMGRITLVGWLYGFRAQIGSVANWKYATFVRLLGEAATRGGAECGPCPDLALNTLAFALQLRKNH